MYSIKEVSKILRENQIPTAKTETISVSSCYHRVLAKDVFSNVNVPEHNRSAMDGYCVNTNDSGDVKILKTIYAGDFFDITAKKNTCCRVMTGAMIPDGYDAVIRQEDVEVRDLLIHYEKKLSPGENISYRGEDLKKGALVLKKGTILNSIHSGVLASMGYAKVCVYQKMKVAILATGSELLYPGAPFQKGKIYGSTMNVLSSYLKNCGISVVDTCIVSDDRTLISNQISRLAKISDVVITTGGVSVGIKDYLSECMKILNAEMLYDSVAMKPGTPTKAYRLDSCIILCFSGNPFAALANFEVTFWPICAGFYKSELFMKKKNVAKIEHGFLKASKFVRLVRAKIENGKISLCSSHESSVLSNMMDTNIYILQPAGEELDEGKVVSYITAGDICFGQ